MYNTFLRRLFLSSISILYFAYFLLTLTSIEEEDRMNLKKTVIPFLVSLFTLVLPFSSVFADSAGWQATNVWQQRVHWNSTLDYYITNVDDAPVSGNVLVCLRSGGGTYFYVKEYDPDNKDDHITYAYLEPTDYTNSTRCKMVDISSSQDGSNNKAEIYVQTLNSNAVFSIYD
jgi:hypothetical protein